MKENTLYGTVGILL